MGDDTLRKIIYVEWTLMYSGAECKNNKLSGEDKHQNIAVSKYLENGDYLST